MYNSNIFLIQVIFGVLHLFCVSALVIFCYRIACNPDQKLLLLVIMVMNGFVFAVAKHYIFGKYFNLSYPYNTFLFFPKDRYNDFFNMLRACKDNNPYFTTYWLKSVYFPAANTFFYFFSLISNELLSFVTYMCVFLVFYVFSIKKMAFALNTFYSIIGFIIFSGLTYPFIFSMDRANLDIYIFLLLLGFIVLFQKKYYIGSTIFLSLAIAMKLYPGVFIFLYLKEKKYVFIGITVVLTLSISVLSLITFEGGFIKNIYGMLSSLQSFNQRYSQLSGIQHNVSYYGALKLIAVWYYYAVQGISDSNVVFMLVNGAMKIPYGIFVVGIFTFILIYVLKYERTLWKNVYLLCAAMVLLPHVSFDYKLIHILIPIILFLRDDSWTPFYGGYLVLFGIMLIPNNYFYLIEDVSIAVIIYPIIITTLAILVITEGIKNKKIMKF